MWLNIAQHPSESFLDDLFDDTGVRFHQNDLRNSSMVDATSENSKQCNSIWSDLKIACRINLIMPSLVSYLTCHSRSISQE